MITGPNWARRYDAEHRRACARPGCSAPAAATLRFQSTRREAWLVEVDYAAARTEGDLCAHHANALVLPRGWHIHDERAPTVVAADAAEDAHEVVVDDVADHVAGDDPCPEQDLATLLDARTPLLQRAFENAKSPRSCEI